MEIKTDFLTGKNPVESDEVIRSGFYCCLICIPVRKKHVTPCMKGLRAFYYMMPDMQLPIPPMSGIPPAFSSGMFATTASVVKTKSLNVHYCGVIIVYTTSRYLSLYSIINQ